MANHKISTEIRNVDVVVVGSGFAGSAAAMTAAKAGATVALFEKAPELGGSTALSAGMFWTAPSIDSYSKRIPLGNGELGAELVLDFPTAVEELRSSGAWVAPEPTNNIMTFGTGYATDIQALLRWCHQEIRNHGGTIYCGTPVVDLLTDERRITGVLTRDVDGALIAYEAGAVVLATGGFQGAPEELARHVGPNSDRLLLRSNKGSVGDGMRLARAAGGGGTSGMGTFYGHLIPWPVQQFQPEHYLPYSQYYSGSAILVNLFGQRFADETEGDELLNQALVSQPQARGVLIFDEHVRAGEAAAEPFPGLGAVDRYSAAREAGGRHLEAASIEELVDGVAAWGIDAEALSRTIHGYTRSAAAGGGIADGIRVSSTARAPHEGPFYALMVQPSITFTFGGIRTDTTGQVLDHDGRPIAGLFAAGADIGGLSNYGYVGGLAPAYITGRWAGISAARSTQTNPPPTPEAAAAPAMD